MANIISCIRIACGIGLIFPDPFSKWFYLLYIVGGISDAFDGFIARKLKTESKLGAKLDTIADFIFIFVVLFKVLNMIHVSRRIIIWIICIAIIKCINIISGTIRSGHFISEHTLLNKTTGVLLFVIPLCVGKLSEQAVNVLIILTCLIATAAAIQEGYYIRIGKEID